MNLKIEELESLYETTRVESDRLFALLPEWPSAETENLWLRRVVAAGLGRTWLAWKRAMYERKALLQARDVMRSLEGESNA